MATYKVIQDIEAEDKFVGPLTLKQFVFAMGGSLFGYLSFFAITKGFTLALAILLPPAFFGFFMAVPWSKDQPTDIWVLAKIRFRIKSRKRIWDQEGLQELVKITAPKKIEKPLTKNMSQTEVKSRLKALAETIDSRGWVIKNTPLQVSYDPNSERLVNTNTLPPSETTSEEAIPDMMDKSHEGLDSLIEESDNKRRVELYEKMDRVRSGQPLRVINRSGSVVTPPSETPQNSEQDLSAKLKASRQAGDISRGNMHSIPARQSMPYSAPVADDDADASTDAEQKTEVEKAQASMTEQAVPDILELAQNNDLNVATIARQANNKDAGYEPKEVVISLH